MTSRVTCRCGHSWSAISNGPLACPACGAPVGLSAAETATLPPKPQPAAPETATLPPSEAVPAAQAGSLAVPGYEILGELGRGGMGVVYKARHTKLDRIVALKMILSGSHAGEADLARFRTEGEAIARLQHPNIVQIYEVGEHEGKPYFSLEFCAGGSLEQRVGRDAAEAQGRGAAGGITGASHPRGPQEGDRPPRPEAGQRPAHRGRHAEDHRLRVGEEARRGGPDGEWGDHGHAVVHGTGTGGWQAEGDRPAADVYALGAILYECLTGRPPFKAATALDTIMQVVSDEPVPPRA